LSMPLVFQAIKDFAMIFQQQKNKGNKEKLSNYIRNPKITERDIDDTAFLVDPETDAIFYLNPLCKGIWQLLIKPTNELEVARIVQQAFPDVPHDKLAEDVSIFIGDMSKRNLILRHS